MIAPILNIGNQTTFKHHRCGWSYAIDSLLPLHKENGIRFEGFLDEVIFRKKIIDEPFVGFFHNPILTPSGVHRKYENMGLYNHINSDCWRSNRANCMGVFVLSRDMKSKFSDMTDCPCEALTHPVQMCEKKFSMKRYSANPRVVHLGQWMRRFDSFDRLSCPQEKIGVCFTDEYGSSKVRLLSYLSNDTFDDFLSSSVVFIHFFDVAACNSILDCIARDTPIVCNRLPAAEEYLGSDYPAFFDSLKEAEMILRDSRIIEKAHTHIKEMNKEKFLGFNFANDLYNSKILNFAKKSTIKIV